MITKKSFGASKLKAVPIEDLGERPVSFQRVRSEVGLALDLIDTLPTDRRPSVFRGGVTGNANIEPILWFAEEYVRVLGSVPADQWRLHGPFFGALRRALDAPADVAVVTEEGVTVAESVHGPEWEMVAILGDLLVQDIGGSGSNNVLSSWAMVRNYGAIGRFLNAAAEAEIDVEPYLDKWEKADRMGVCALGVGKDVVDAAWAAVTAGEKGDIVAEILNTDMGAPDEQLFEELFAAGDKPCECFYGGSGPVTDDAGNPDIVCDECDGLFIDFGGHTPWGRSVADYLKTKSSGAGANEGTVAFVAKSLGRQRLCERHAERCGEETSSGSSAPSDESASPAGEGVEDARVQDPDGSEGSEDR